MTSAAGGADPEVGLELARRLVRVGAGDDEVIDAADHGSDASASGRLAGPMSQSLDRPAPGSHDRSVPSGSLEESAANLFDAMLAAREAEERGRPGPLREFYRTLMTGTLLLPVPPEHGEEAKAALASAVNDDEQVEISVMLARATGGEAVSVRLRLGRRAGRLGAARHRQPAAAGADRDRQPGRRRNAGDHGPRRAGAVPLRGRRARGARRRAAARHATSRSSSRPRAARSASAVPGRDTRELERSLVAELREPRSMPRTWSRPMTATALG